MLIATSRRGVITLVVRSCVVKTMIGSAEYFDWLVGGWE